jgi:hypothetical protein
MELGAGSGCEVTSHAIHGLLGNEEDKYDDLGSALNDDDCTPAVDFGNTSISDWDVVSSEGGRRSPEASSATSESVSEPSLTAMLSTLSAQPQEGGTAAAKTVSRLHMIDGLQLVCGPNAWTYPDTRLNMLSNETLSKQDQHVSSLVVQLSSPTFSFQLLSSCLGWPVRIYPRDAKPLFDDLHASHEGLLLAGSRDHCTAVAVNGANNLSLGHGHNFHIHEEVGDVITIHCARSLKYREAEELQEFSSSAPLGTSRERLAHVLLTEVQYQVWYDLSHKGTLKKRVHTIEEYEEEVGAFIGGDNFEICRHLI